MKKRLLLLLVAGIMLTSCGNTDIADIGTETNVQNTPESEIATEIHTHSYAEEVTTEATCEADGVKTFTCECGDSYTETITAIGHIYENYVYNEDATYLADGTETATCNHCELTDTRTASGTKLEYTYTDMSATKYAKQSVNVRNLPSTDGEKLGGLSTNQEVVVTGQCNETSWYGIEYKDSVAYVSNSYLVDEKIVVETAPAETTTNTNDAGSNNTLASTSTENPYPLYQVIDDGGNNVYFYWLWDGVSTAKDQNYWDCYNACREILKERNPGKNGGGAGGESTGYYVDDMQVVKATPIIF